MNPEIVCNYAYIRFVPNAEMDEFANVGIVLMIQQPLSFQFKLEKRWTERMRAFFNGTDPESYVSGCNALETELKRVAALVGRATQGKEPDLPGFNEAKLIRLFQNVISPREGTFQFSEARTVLTDKPDRALKELFSQIVTQPNPHMASPDLRTMAV